MHVQRGRSFRTIYVQVKIQVQVHDAEPGFWLQRPFRNRLVCRPEADEDDAVPGDLCLELLLKNSVILLPPKVTDTLLASYPQIGPVCCHRPVPLPAIE